jgi:hypothetical protein
MARNRTGDQAGEGMTLSFSLSWPMAFSFVSKPSFYLIYLFGGAGAWQFIFGDFKKMKIGTFLKTVLRGSRPCLK